MLDATAVTRRAMDTLIRDPALMLLPLIAAAITNMFRACYARCFIMLAALHDAGFAEAERYAP